MLQRLGVLVLVLAVSATAAPAADPVEGAWVTPRDRRGLASRVQIAPCGEALCGTLIEVYGPDGLPVHSSELGRPIVWDMVPRGEGRYGGGRVYALDRGRIYDSNMELSGDRLAVSGCLLVICSTQTWQRVP